MLAKSLMLSVKSPFVAISHSIKCNNIINPRISPLGAYSYCKSSNYPLGGLCIAYILELAPWGLFIVDIFWVGAYSRGSLIRGGLIKLFETCRIKIQFQNPFYKTNSLNINLQQCFTLFLDVLFRDVLFQDHEAWTSFL